MSAATDFSAGNPSTVPTEAGEQTAGTQNSQTTTAGAWRAGISEEFREHPSITRYTNLNEMAKGLINANELIGRKGVPLPKEGDPADQARFWNALGRPESPDGYDLGDFTPPEGVVLDDALRDSFFAKAHEVGLTKAQAQALVEWQVGEAQSMLGSTEQAVAQAREQAVSTLRKEWGTAFDARINLAARAVAEFAGDGADALLQTRLSDGSALGDHPAFVRLMASAAMKIGEGDLASDAAIRTVAGHTPESALQAIREFEANADNMKAMFDRSHIAHEETMRKREELYRIAFPDTNR